MRYVFRKFLISLVLLGALACQGQGRVHETPPPSYPNPGTEYPPEKPTGAPLGAPLPPSGVPEPEGATDDAARPRSAESESVSGYSAPPAPAPTSRERPAAQGGAPERLESEYRGIGRSRAAQRPAERTERPRERPGLATHWGETRYSPTRQVEFVRSDFSHPREVLELHYNDRDGALHMLPGASLGQCELYALGGGLEIEMVDSSGRAYRALRRGDRVVAIGNPGARYALVVHNRSGVRFEIVATVDGLDVLDGTTGSVTKRGYLVAPYSSITIDGFRRSDAEVAAFRLGDVARSYAASKGKARNVGVIGIAVFEEAGRPFVAEQRSRWDDTHLRQTADPFPGGYAQPPVCEAT